MNDWKLRNTPQALVERILPSHATPFLLTCEHASNCLPSPWTWPSEDQWLQSTHWAYDPGAANLTRRVSAMLSCSAVLACFTRLLIDPNRPLESPCLFRTAADEHTIHLNTELSLEERHRRHAYYRAYHKAVAGELSDSTTFLLSIHSFNPVYEGRRRELEAGILHVDDYERAKRWTQALGNHGLLAEVDCPYAGADGFMYSAERHGKLTGRRALMIEIRNDLLSEEEHVEGMAEMIARCLRDVG